MTLPIRQARERGPRGPSKGLLPSPGARVLQAVYLALAPSTCLSRAGWLAGCPLCLTQPRSPTLGVTQDEQRRARSDPRGLEFTNRLERQLP